MAAAQRFGDRLREWRQRRRLSQEALGKKVGSDGPRIHRLEQGSENPTLESLDKLAEALQIDVGEFLITRPEEDASSGERPREGNPILERLRLEQLDAEADAEDSARGDILRAQHALEQAHAALNRALRRADPKSGTA